MTPLDGHHHYTVAWLAALPSERAAAEILLDEEHGKPKGFTQHDADTNSYTWGRMGKHNIVIASLPAGEYGTIITADMTSSLRASLPHIRVGLFVGIAAGVTGERQESDGKISIDRDIRLGDICVSSPDKTNGGIVQYDLYKAKSRAVQSQDGTVTSESYKEAKGFVNAPPRALRGALAALQARHLREDPEDSKIQQHLKTFDRNKNTKKFAYPGTLDCDKTADSDDSDDGDSDNEDPLRVQINDKSAALRVGSKHKKLKSRTQPDIHYGTIASGNTLLKDTTVRDGLLTWLKQINIDPICFEMEAAGIMGSFPSLVIRGICDYGDERKNDNWQKYAAATAAAFGKEFLEVLNPEEVEQELPIRRVEVLVEKLASKVDEHMLDHRQQQVVSWLSAPDPSTNFNKAKKQRHAGTGTWFLKINSYKQWQENPCASLWLHGLAGCGKTVLSSTIIRDLQDKSSENIVLYFFFDFNDAAKQSFGNMLRSLLKQLYYQSKSSQKHLDQVYSGGKGQLDETSLTTAFHLMIRDTENLYVVLDALDECEADTRKDLLNWLAFLSQDKLRRVFTSRKEFDIEASLTEWLRPKSCQSIQCKLVDDDIRATIRGRLAEDRDLRRWQSRPDVREEIEEKLMEKANGMFRWAVCQLDVLRDCLDLPTLKNALSSLPYDLDETYQRILSNLVSHPGYERNAVRLLQFLTYSKRPLRLEEAIDAIAVYPNLGSYENSFSTDNRLPNPDEIIRYCSSLVKVTKRKGKLYNHRKRALGEKRTISELQLAHFSVKEYLVSARVQERFKEPLSETRAKAAIVEVSISYMLVAAPNYGQVDHNELPLVELAAKYWTEHARKAEVDHETVVAWSQKLCETTDALSLCQDINKDFECEAFLTLRDGRREGFANPLYYASLAGLSQTAKKLLDEGAEVNTMIGGTFNFALTAAAYNGHTVVARLLLDRGADIEAVSKISGSALYAASSQGHKAVVECLLDKGADIEAASSKFGSALFAASSHGHRAVVGFLLDKGADIEAASSKFGSALYAASLHGHRTVVELLLDKGAYIDRIGGKFGCPLFAASNNKHEAVVELLLDRGSSWVDLHRAFPIASQGGHECLVKMLLAKVANVGFSEPKGDALRSTSSEGDEEIVKLLLGHRADVGFREQKGDTLRFASSEGHEEIIELLLDYRAEFNFHRQGAALQVASYQGYEKGVQRLRDRGADLSFHGKYGTALQAASSDGHENLVKLLLDHGADVDFHEEYGTARPAQYGTALQAASYWGHEKVVQLLIDRGADVNLNEGFDTALQIAIKNGHETILQLLIDHGADVNASGGISGNAIEAASEMGHEKVVELLLDRGADVKFSAALQVASYVGHEKVVQLLLDRGADVNASDYDLGTAIEAASCRAHKRILTRRPIVQLLLREGASYTFNWSVGGSSTQYEYVTACQCVSDDEQETGSDDEIDSEEIDGEDADSEETDHSRRKNDRGWNSCSITL